MRITATFISIVALLVCSCSLEPKSTFDARAALSQLKGPETGTIQGSLLEQALQAESAGDYKRAAQMYKQLSDKDEGNIGFALGLGNNLRRAGDNNAALRIADNVIKKEPHNAAAFELKGLCLMNVGEFSDAGKAFADVMQYDKKRWRTLDGIAILFAMKNRDKEAFEYFQAALDQSTDNPAVLNNMGLALAMDKQYDKAIDALERARRHLPGDSPQLRNVDLNLALVYSIDGNLDAAEQTASPHLTKEGLYNNMGFYAYLAKNTDLAKGYLNMALTQSPVYYERAWKNLAMVGGDASSESGGVSDSTGSPLKPSHRKSAGHTDETAVKAAFADRQQDIDLSAFGTPDAKEETSGKDAPKTDAVSAATPAPTMTQTPNPAVAPASSMTPPENSATPAYTTMAPASGAVVSADGPHPVPAAEGTPLGDIPAAKTMGTSLVDIPASKPATAMGDDDDSQKSIAEIEKTDVAPGAAKKDAVQTGSASSPVDTGNPAH